MAGLFDKVRDMIVDLMAVEEDEVLPGASLVEDLGADSLDLVKFITVLEKELSSDGFTLKITDDDAEGIETVQQVIDMLVSKGVPA